MKWLFRLNTNKTTNWEVSSKEFPYFDAVRRLEVLYIKRERRNIRKLQTQADSPEVKPESWGLTSSAQQWAQVKDLKKPIKITFYVS